MSVPFIYMIDPSTQAAQGSIVPGTAASTTADGSPLATGEGGITSFEQLLAAQTVPAGAVTGEGLDLLGTVGEEGIVPGTLLGTNLGSEQQLSGEGANALLSQALLNGDISTAEQQALVLAGLVDPSLTTGQTAEGTTTALLTAHTTVEGLTTIDTPELAGQTQGQQTGATILPSGLPGVTGQNTQTQNTSAQALNTGLTTLQEGLNTAAIQTGGSGDVNPQHSGQTIAQQAIATGQPTTTSTTGGTPTQVGEQAVKTQLEGTHTNANKAHFASQQQQAGQAIDQGFQQGSQQQGQQKQEHSPSFLNTALNAQGANPLQQQQAGLFQLQTGAPDPTILQGQQTSDTIQHVQHVQTSTRAEGTQTPILSQTPNASPAEQVRIQISNLKNSDDGVIKMNLHPAELGQVEVRIERQDGKTNILILAEKSETLDMLQRDARVLERSLNDQGIKTESGNLNFNLRDGQQHAGQQQNSSQTHGDDSFGTDHASLEHDADEQGQDYTGHVHVTDGLDIKI